MESRSKNQQATLKLYVAIKNNAEKLNENIAYKKLAMELAAIAFSLWRAVFLSDLTDSVEEQFISVNKFLENLIGNNAIAYPQDLASKEWTFRYYLYNARKRLQDIAAEDASILDPVKIQLPASTARDDWMLTQDALETAINNFSDRSSLG